MATDFNKQAARLVAAIPTDSQGDGRKFADAVRKSLNYIATYAGTGNGSGGGSGGGGTVTTTSNQLSNVRITHEKSGDYYNLTVTWETGDFNEARVYKYALLNLQQAPQKGDTSVNWNQVGSRIYQSKDGATTATIPNVLPGYRYRVVAIGVTDDGKRSEESKAPSAITFIPVQIRDTTPPASLTTTATAKGLLIEWTQQPNAFYTYTELRDGNNNFGVDDGLLTRSRGKSYLYVPKERNGTIYAANFGISEKYSTSLDSSYSFQQLTTPEAPTVTVDTDDNEDQYKITVAFKAPTYGLGTNVYINNVKFTVDYTQHSFTYYTTKEHDTISLTYFDCIGESNHSTSVAIDVSNPRHSDLNTFIDIHSNRITSKDITTNDINTKSLHSDTIEVDSLTINDTIVADAVESNRIKAKELSADSGSIRDFTADTINAVDATLGTADVSTLTYMNMSPTDGADGMITANRIISNGTISTTGEVDANKIVFTVNDSTTENPSVGKESWLSDGKEDYGLVLRGKKTYFNGVGKENKAWINNETGAANFSGSGHFGDGVTIDGDLNVNGAVYGNGGLGAPYELTGQVKPEYVITANFRSDHGHPYEHSRGVAWNQLDVTPMFQNGTYTLQDVINTLLRKSVTFSLGATHSTTTGFVNCNCDC
nr:MAG TPA: hypothetical protein [Caudoviricetes sp.]